MKTKILLLIAMMVTGTVSNTFAQVGTASESGMNAFSFSEYLLMSLCAVMLVTIWLLAKTIRQLTEQMR